MPNRWLTKQARTALGVSPVELQRELRGALLHAQDANKAVAMKAYMKSSMPFFGIQKDELRVICKRVFDAKQLHSAAEWRKACLHVWREAEYREERYAAIELTGHKLYCEYQSLDALSMYEEFIVTGAWWDYVDEIAKWRVGHLLAKYPGQMRKKMLAWSRSKDLWKRRTAILCQLGFQEKTDLELLYSCIKPSLASREFFLQKAIGWALRQYAWTDPTEIKRFVAAHEGELSRLSKREAMKNIG